MNDGTDTTTTPTFLENWGHLFWMAPIIAITTFATGHWAAILVFIPVELAVFAYHTRTHHPDHPMQSAFGKLVRAFVTVLCVLGAQWQVVYAIRSGVSGMQGVFAYTVVTMVCTVALWMISVVIHEKVHGHPWMDQPTLRPGNRPVELTLAIGVIVACMVAVHIVFT